MATTKIGKGATMAGNPLMGRFIRRPKALRDIGLREWTEMSWRALFDCIACCGVHEGPNGELTIAEPCLSYCAGKDVEDILNDFSELYAPWGGLDSLLELDDAAGTYATAA